MTGLICTILIALREPTRFNAEKETSSEVIAQNTLIENAETQYQRRCDKVASQYGLSEREKEVLVYLGKGRNLPYIRDKLYISRNTVNTHVKHIYVKLSIHSKRNCLMCWRKWNNGLKRVEKSPSFVPSLQVCPRGLPRK